MMHLKTPGCVEHIDSTGWQARLVVDDDEYLAEMRAPLPSHAVIGSLFTIHQTKAGAAYLYWITKPTVTKRQIKLARQWARRASRLFQ
jgi:hypothetical protein